MFMINAHGDNDLCGLMMMFDNWWVTLVIGLFHDDWVWDVVYLCEWDVIRMQTNGGNCPHKNNYFYLNILNEYLFAPIKT